MWRNVVANGLRYAACLLVGAVGFGILGGLLTPGEGFAAFVGAVPIFLWYALPGLTASVLVVAVLPASLAPLAWRAAAIVASGITSYVVIVVVWSALVDGLEVVDRASLSYFWTFLPTLAGVMFGFVALRRLTSSPARE
jgi:hypothetical protein